jgi:glycerophosphoryl diester phosphodiesterase
MQRPRLRCLGAALACALFVLAPVRAEPRPPKVIAHRGVVSEAPENTLPAIAKAIELGCAMAEIDLRYTADGEIVLIHDAVVDRTTNGTGRVADKTLAELKALDAGSLAGERFRGTRIPTFQEAVELARGRIELYLDLKESDPLPVVRLVEKLAARSMVVYRPYTSVALRQILSETPQARVLIDLGDWVQVPRLVEALRREFPTSAFSGDLANWTSEALATARRNRALTFVNVLGATDTPENLARAAVLGFDYIQTDHPRVLLDLLHRPKTTSRP